MKGRKLMDRSSSARIQQEEERTRKIDTKNLGGYFGTEDFVPLIFLLWKILIWIRVSEIFKHIL